MDVLLIGCGGSRLRKIRLEHDKGDFIGDNLTTIDMNPDCNPDVVMDLGGLGDGDKLPFPDSNFDEIHAYDVLEHLGRQGDWRGYFTEFAEYHRVLKDGGRFYIIVPIGSDAYADPGHTRFFSVNHFRFLSRKFYETHPSDSSYTDYRWFWKKDFDVDHVQTVGDHHLAVILVKT